MTIWRLVIKEIVRRKISFVSGLISVILSVSVLVGSLTTLKILDLRTDQIMLEKEKETRQRMDMLEDDYRKIMKILGFNLLIIPQNQKLAEFYMDDVVSEYMPESYATTLSEANIVTIQHILPSLQLKIKWPEKKRTILLIGTRGEVAPLFRNAKEPILAAVPKDHAIIGYELAESFSLKPGGNIVILGQTFTIAQCNEERGNKDDITIWIDLAQAQELAHKPGLINAILALKCHCAGNDIASVRRDISAILAGVQVIEQGKQVITRAEARDRAKSEAAAALAAEMKNRRQIRHEQEQVASILTPLIFLVSAVWIGLVFFTNVRERKSEIGILYAFGTCGRKIIALFLSKALIMGVLGGCIGYFLGISVALSRQESITLPVIENLQIFSLALLTAAILSIAASWIPAYYASQQDPAQVLREE